METQQFLAEFGHIANAPGGVGQLRDLILSLAFTGSLCERSQESIEELLDYLDRQRRATNIETRKQRLARNAADVDRSNGPHAIPDNWHWISLSAVGHTWGQKRPLDDFYYIDVSSIDNRSGLLSDRIALVSATAAPSRARKVVKTGTLVYSTVRPYLLNIAIIDRTFDLEPIASTAFAVIHPWKGVEARFIYFYLRSPHFVKYVESVQIGMAYPAISDEKFYSGVLPLPPTEEQARIVAKVDELMALCDELEQQQHDRRKLQNALRHSTLQAIASAQSIRRLEASWKRLDSGFNSLFGEQEDVRKLRDVLCDLAIRGITSPTSKMGHDANLDDTVTRPLAHGWEWKPLSNLSEYITSLNNSSGPNSRLAGET